jgi:hypothetical protein
MPHPPEIDTLLAEDGWIRRMAQSLVADADAADDPAQDAWLAALARPRAARASRPWIFGVLRNLRRTGVRARIRRERREHDAARGEVVPSANEVVAEVALRRTVAEHLLELEEPFRTALFLRFFRDLPLKEIVPYLGGIVTSILCAAVAGCGSRAGEGDLVRLRCIYAAVATPDAHGALLQVLLPAEVPGVQAIVRLAIEPPPDRRLVRDGVDVAVWEMMDPPERLRIVVEATVRLGAGPGASADEPGVLDARELGESLPAERFLERDDDDVRALAAQIAGETTRERVASAVALTLERLRYELHAGEALGAAGALARGAGDSAEHADLLVALLRADGIPARHVRGVHGLAAGARESVAHSWAEVWLGAWTVVDPLAVRRGAPLDAPPGVDGVYVAFTRARNVPPWSWWNGNAREGEVAVRFETELERLTPAREASR